MIAGIAFLLLCQRVHANPPISRTCRVLSSEDAVLRPTVDSPRANRPAETREEGGKDTESAKMA